MGEANKRPAQKDEHGQRKKHRGGEHWRHYDVEGQFNASVEDSEEKTNDKSGDGESGEACVDGSLKGDVHVNSKGLIVGQAEVHNDHKDIDVNFEIQASRKNTGKRDSEDKTPQNKSKKDSPGSPGPKGPRAPSDTSATSSEESEGPTPRSGLTADQPVPQQQLTPLTSTTSEAANSNNNSSKNNAADSNEENGEDTNSIYSKDESVSSTEGKAKDGSSSEIIPEPFNLSSTQVNQAPFIQKLYAMLEDPKLHHVIRWAPSSDRFFINPNEQFSQTLCLYFKHTNISSFVRQLSMYGFHKVSNTNSQRDKWYPWEFRHMDGAFKRGDLESLRSIKRRSTRQMNGKRVKYMTVVSGNDIKQEPSPGYIPGNLPTQQQQQQPSPSQPLPHYVPDGPRSASAMPFVRHPSPIQQQQQQHMVYHEVNGANGGGAVNSITHPLNGNMNGGNMNMHTSAGTPLGSNKDQTMRLLRMHQSVQSQLMMVQETMGRLTQNVNEMGLAIDQLVSQQPPSIPLPTPPQKLPAEPLAPTPTPYPSINGDHSETAPMVLSSTGTPISNPHPPPQADTNRFQLRALLN